MEDGARGVNGPASVAVIGAGWSGAAAAVRLARAGVRVTVYEQAHEPGGRARTIQTDGRALDNGQHLLLGAYTETLALLDILHPEGTAALFHDLPLTLRPFAAGSSPLLRAANLPAPWHLVAAMLTARRLGWRERTGFLRLAVALGTGDHADDTVQHRFRALPPLLQREVITPLCLAALNTPPERASARIFRNVLQAALGSTARASRFLVPRIGLGDLLPRPALALVRNAQGAVRLGSSVRAVVPEHGRVSVRTRQDDDAYDAVLIAVGPHQLQQIDVATSRAREVQQQVSAFTYEGIHTAHLGYTQATMACPIERLDDAPGQWIFDHGNIVHDGQTLRLLSVVLSANGAHDAWSHDALVHAFDVQLRRLAPTLGALRFARVIAEKRATYACTPGLSRPTAGAMGGRVHLAGDYTYAAFPATLEAAVRAGNIAADSVLQEIGAFSPQRGAVCA